MFSFEGAKTSWISGDDSEEDPPVPMPNTVVKLFSVDDTWWVTARESRELPEQKSRLCLIEDISGTDLPYMENIFLNSSVGRACGC